jgi:hypothetical protein
LRFSRYNTGFGAEKHIWKHSFARRSHRFFSLHGGINQDFAAKRSQQKRLNPDGLAILYPAPLRSVTKGRFNALP